VKRARCRILALVALGLIASACRVDDVPALGTAVIVEPDLTLDIAGETRRYQLYIPETEPPDDAWPLVIVLHGLGGSAARVRALAGFDDVAAEHSFIVAYPEGLSSAWIDGGISGSFTEDDIATRNLAFLAELIDSLDAGYGLDERRVYLAGISNGGMFAFHAACNLSERIAAVGLVAATGLSYSVDSCMPAEPVSYVAFHGTSDVVVPYDGGLIVPGFEDLGSFQSAHESAAFWAATNGCAPEPVSEDLPDTIAGDISIASRESWEACTSGAVQLITLDGSGHTWPGHPPATQRLGATNLDIDATEMLWEFFATNPKVGEEATGKRESPEASW
jgi:polyhydroxybutyrate depolymerase